MSDDSLVAVGCQGGGSHTAFTAGVLKALLRAELPGRELIAFSGTSGGAVNATLAWYGLVTDGPDRAIELLDEFWAEIAASDAADRLVNEWVVAQSRIRSSGAAVPDVSPYHTPFAGWARDRFRQTLEDLVAFERVEPLCERERRRLIVGTVNVNDGTFETFSDEEVTAEAVLASAAVPDLFPAVRIHGHWHWDGLFSQNPPIHEFTLGGAGTKPDEIWVVQINPQRRDGEPRSLEEIEDRRNELSGNISLNQELRFIETVNGWVESGHLSAGSYKRIDVEKIEMPKTFHCSTKVDRSPAFIERLVAMGEREAEAFLSG